MTRRRLWDWLILLAVGLLGTFGLGLLLAPGGPDASQVRLEVGGAIISGVMLSAAFLIAERRLEREDQRRERSNIERQTRQQYQLALAMERDLAERYLAGINLAEIQLPERDLSGSRLTRTDLSRANLASANLRRADLAAADLTSANLRGANLSEANLRGANLTGADLYKANLSGAKLNAAILTSAILYCADLTGAQIASAYLPSGHLYEIQMAGEVLPIREHPLMGGGDMPAARWDPASPPWWPDEFQPPDNGWDASRRK